MTSLQETRCLLGRRVNVTLDDQVVVTGVLLGFGDDGSVEIKGDNGIHWCWPMLSVEEAQREH